MNKNPNVKSGKVGKWESCGGNFEVNPESWTKTFRGSLLTSAMHHPKTLIGQALLHQTIVNYTKFFSNKIIKVSLFDITI